MWLEISNINAKNIYIVICYFSLINSTFYKKNNLDKKNPYNGLEWDIHTLRNEGNVLLLGGFYARIRTNQVKLLS
jgi:hypothetical protein